MNYKNCIPTKRFEVGDVILPDDWDIKNSREIVRVLKTGYKFKCITSNNIHSSVNNFDPYMIWWSKISSVKN